MKSSPPSQLVDPSVKLNFHHVKFCGRRKELDFMQSAFRGAANSSSPKACTILLQGDSGSGKSSLVRAFRESVLCFEGSCFSRGKFEKGRAAAEPFCAILQAINGVLRQILKDEQDHEFWRGRFKAELSTTDSTIVQNLLPLLKILLNEDNVELKGVSDKPQFHAEAANDDLFHETSSLLPAARGYKSTGSKWFLAGKFFGIRNKFAHASNAITLPRSNQRYDGDASSSPSTGFCGVGEEWSFERLRFSLRSLIRAVSLSVPLTLFLDDLQWAGEDSLMLLQTVMCDKKPRRKLLIIGAYRPVAAEHPLYTRILSQPWRNTTRVTAPSLGSTMQPLWVKIDLHNLEELDTLELLSSLLHTNDDGEVRSLVSVVFRKTQGNPFFVVQFLRLLEQRKFLFYSHATCKWEWRSDLVYHEADIADNVSNVVADKIRGMPELQQDGLTRAACLGVSRFDFDTLARAFGLHELDNIAADATNANASNGSTVQLDPQDSLRLNSRASLYGALRAAAEAGFLEEKRSSRQFKFVHDRIREGAYSLLPDGAEKSSVHLAIGRQLLRTLPPTRQGEGEPHQLYPDSPVQIDDDGSLLLQCVCQLNLGSALITDAEERRSVAELNYKAAEMAMTRSAFFPASDFLANGIDLMCRENRNEAWSKHYSLMLMLSIAKTRMEYCAGRYEMSIESADDVITHSRSFADRELVYHTKILCLTRQNKTVAARELTKTALSELEVHFPIRFLRFCAVKEILRTKLMLWWYSDEDLLNLPETVNPVANRTAEFLQKLAELALNSSIPEPSMLLFVLLYGVRISVRDGRYLLTAIGLVTWGWILAQMSLFDEALRFGNIGLQYAKSRNRHDTRAILIYHYYLAHWKLPYHQCLGPMSNAIEQYWETGAIEYIGDTYLCLSLGFCCGRRLDELANDVENLAEQLEDYKMTVSYEIFAPFFQMVSNLSGRSEHSIKLVGEYMDQDKLLQSSATARARQMVYFFQFLLACFFGDFAGADELLMNMGDALSEGPDVWVPYRFFFEGLTAFDLARSSGKGTWCQWTYRRKGQSIVRRFRQWVNKGATNCRPLLLLLQAEQLALHSADCAHFGTILSAYDDAIDAIDRLGTNYYVHISALYNERTGNFCYERGEAHQAFAYFKRAKDYYVAWGAVGKVKQLETAYPNLV